MLITSIVILAGILFVYVFMQTAPFGSKPSGDRLKKVQASVHYKAGQFQNLSPTPALTEGVSIGRVFKEYFFQGSKRRIPSKPLPSQKTNLLDLNPEQNLLIWFGHSSYFMQINRRTFLVDPVLTGNASPLSFTPKSFKGTDVYAVKDFPEIDYLIITHDHWDHLDYKTVLPLKPKIKKIITSLGVGAHLERWGFESGIIDEKDWNEESFLEPGFHIRSLTARHFSGRGFKRNGALWSSFLLTTPSRKIYIGGDSGYDRHFSEIGKLYGPIDLAILENGQYDEKWRYIHMFPEETIQAALDLRARKLLPVHWGKFSLSVHAWDEPILRIKKEAGLKNISLMHPEIGEIVNLDAIPIFKNWWEGID